MKNLNENWNFLFKENIIIYFNNSYLKIVIETIIR